MLLLVSWFSYFLDALVRLHFEERRKTPYSRSHEMGDNNIGRPHRVA